MPIGGTSRAAVTRCLRLLGAAESCPRQPFASWRLGADSLPVRPPKPGAVLNEASAAPPAHCWR